MHLNQPNKDDAVLGGNAPTYSGVVLGGIEGVKSALSDGGVARPAKQY
jgi:hypothetical protein